LITSSACLLYSQEAIHMLGIQKTCGYFETGLHLAIAAAIIKETFKLN